ncbi:MAG: cation diffusion facilitator family transporter [Smithellaceae bacterium]
MTTKQHNHHHNEKSWGNRLVASMLMNLIIPAVQIYGGIVSGSMALISDALHNLSDFISLVINYAALIIGKRPPTLKQTFGYKRVEIFATLLSVALLYGAGFYIAAEAWGRFREPQPIAGQLVIWIALLGFAGNILSALLLHAGSKVNLNMKSAFLHMLADAATSLGVVALGILWLFKPWYWLDPLFCWLIVAMIFYSGWGLLKDSILILMNATPPGIDLGEIRKSLESIDGIREIHDLHVWNPSADSIALAAHITVPDQMLGHVDELAVKVRDVLATEFNIDHPTLQFECNSCNHGKLLCCIPENGHENHKHH